MALGCFMHRAAVYISILEKRLFFQEHDEAMRHFGVPGDDNEQMSINAAARGYDSIQFLAHYDSQWLCTTAGAVVGIRHMGIEIVATRYPGTYACMSKGSTPLMAGWGGKKHCHCDNNQKHTNCHGFGSETMSATTALNDSVVIV